MSIWEGTCVYEIRWKQEDFHIKVKPERVIWIMAVELLCAINKSVIFIVRSMIIHSQRLKANTDHQISVILEMTKIIMKRAFAFYFLLRENDMAMRIAVILQFMLSTS